MPWFPAKKLRKQAKLLLLLLLLSCAAWLTYVHLSLVRPGRALHQRLGYGRGRREAGQGSGSGGGGAGRARRDVGAGARDPRGLLPGRPGAPPGRDAGADTPIPQGACWVDRTPALGVLEGGASVGDAPETR